MLHLSKLVIWGSSWDRGFRFHWLNSRDARIPGREAQTHPLVLDHFTPQTSETARVEPRNFPALTLWVRATGLDRAGQFSRRLPHGRAQRNLSELQGVSQRHSLEWTTICVCVCVQYLFSPRKGSERASLGRGDDTIGNPHWAQIDQFELFELILLFELDTKLPVERFEAAVSWSTVPSPLLWATPMVWADFPEACLRNNLQIISKKHETITTTH